MKFFKLANALLSLQNNDELFIFKHALKGYDYRITITSDMYKPIQKFLRGFSKKYLIISETEEISIQSLLKIKTFFDVDSISLGQVYQKNYTGYVVFDKKTLRETLANHTYTNENDYDDYIEYNSYINPKNPSKSSSIFQVKNNFKSQKRFDWDEEFMEGMRIFGNHEEAEGYADEQKQKYKRGNH